MRMLIVATTAIALVSGSAWAAEDYNSSRSNRTLSVDTQSGDDPILRKKPGRTTYSNITLKRGVVDTAEADPQPTQIDPPSLQLDAGPSDTSTTGAKASKPKEIVVVGSKAKAKVLPEVDDEVLVDFQNSKTRFKEDGTPLRAK